MRLAWRARRGRLTAAGSISRRYDRILIATLVVVLALAATLVTVDHRNEEATERANIALRVSDRLVELNALVRGTVDAVDALRVHAESVVDGSGSALVTRHQLLRKGPGGMLTLDEAPAGTAGRGHGNVIVAGGPPGPWSWLETRVALGLGSTFADNVQASPFLAWQKFVSAGGTVAIFPWISSRLFPLDIDPRSRMAFFAGTPERNPGRHSFWIGPEADSTGKGPIVGVGTPVYAGDRFLGTVSALVQLERLEDITARLRYPLGRLFVLDGSNRVLVMAGGVPRGPRTFPLGQLEDLAPEARHPGVADAVGQPAGQWRQAGGQLILATELDQAPWRLVYLLSRWELARTVAARSAGGVGGLLAGFLLLLVVAYAATRREFVSPATKLVTHIEALGGEAHAALPKVPANWRPFFTAVSDTFASHGQLVAIRQELDIARKMQEAILPRTFPRHPRVDLRASMTPALEVAGDFYDYFWLDDTRLALVVADVSDKGIGAALFMAVSRTLLRASAPAAASPAAALRAVSDLLVEDNTTNMFVTVFYAVLDVDTGTLVYANGGHNPPLVVSPGGAVDLLPKVRGAALGMFPDQRFDDGRIALSPDATLFLYTDGLTEAMKEDKTQFGTDRLSAALAAHATEPPSLLLEAVLAAVDDFAAGTPKPDDITSLAVRWRWGA